MNLTARHPGRPTCFEVAIDSGDRCAIGCRSTPKLGNRFVNDHRSRTPRKYDCCNRCALSNRAQRGALVSHTLAGVILPDTDAATQLARIEELIEQYRERKRRHLLRRALKLWRKTEADQRLAIFELPPERVH